MKVLVTEGQKGNKECLSSEHDCGCRNDFCSSDAMGTIVPCPAL